MSTFTFSGDWFSEHYPIISGSVSIDLQTSYGEFDSELRLTYNNNSPFRADQKHVFTLYGSYEHVEETDQYILMSQKLDFKQSFMITLIRKPNTYSPEEWSGSYSCIYPYDIGKLSVQCETSCTGCLEDQPNQLAHMDYGGCMYNDDPPATPQVPRNVHDSFLSAVLSRRAQQRGISEKEEAVKK